MARSLDSRLKSADLKRIRLQYNLSQVQWARLTGFSLVSVNKWERGRRPGPLADRYYRLLDNPETVELLTRLEVTRDLEAEDKGGGNLTRAPIAATSAHP